MIDLLIRATLLLVAAVAADRALRRASAAVRSFLWTLTLASVLALPLLTAVAPRELALLPRVGLGPLARVSSSPRPLPHGVGEPSRRFAPTPSREESPAVVRGTGERDGSTPVLPTGRSEWRSLATGGAADLVLSVWLLGGFGVAGRGLLGRVALGRAFDRGRRTGARLRGRIDRLSRRLGVRRRVAARVSDETPVPLVFGWLRPRLLLPAAGRRWDAEATDMVLLHELAHIRRGDLPAQLVGRLAAAVFWMHPLVWLAVGRQRAEAEHACDDLVLAQGKIAASYARVLLAVARGLRPPRAYRGMVATIASRGPLERRLRALIDPERRRARLRRGPALAAVLLASALLVPLASVPGGPTATAATAGAAAAPSPLVGSDCACTDEPHWRLRERPPADGGDRLEPLLARLSTGAATERAGAARALGDWPVVAARRALHEATRDPEPMVRAEAITALGRSPERRDLPRFLEGLEDPSCQVGERAAEALAELGVRSSEASLVARLADGGCRLRVAAASALASFHSPASVAALRAAMDDADPRVRAAAAGSLGVVGSGDTVRALLASLDGGDGQARARAARQLGEEPLGVVGHAAVVAALTAALEDESSHVRQAAAEALSAVGDETAVEALLGRLEDGNKHVRQAAVEALGHLGDARARPSLTRLVAGDSSAHVRQAASEALERLGRDG